MCKSFKGILAKAWQQGVASKLRQSNRLAAVIASHQGGHGEPLDPRWVLEEGESHGTELRMQEAHARAGAQEAGQLRELELLEAL